MPLEPLIRFYETLAPDSVGRLSEFYAADAWFKDPFNEVRGTDAIQRIFIHMFRQVGSPKFIVTERLGEGDGAMLAWEFHFQVRAWRKHYSQMIRGVSHVKFNAEGKVIYHRDYWDAAEELYAKLPVLGWVIRQLQKSLNAKE